MPRIVNHEQYETWNGADGRHWAQHHRRYDAMAAGYTKPLLDAALIRATDHVLDVGCGTGQTTRAAARRAPQGRAVGIDLSEPMLEQARRIAAAEQVGNVSFVQGDAEVHPFPDGGFDAVLSRAGVMFFADPVTAFGNVRRALRPGGRLAFVCHGEPTREAQAIFAALAGHLPAGDAGEPSGVSDFTDPDHIRAVLLGAGFAEPDITAVEVTGVLGTDAADAADFLLEGQLGAFVGALDAEALRRVRQDLTTVLRPCETGGVVRLPARGWLVTARSVD